LAAADPANAAAQRDLAISYEKVGDAQRLLGEAKQALASYGQALDLNQRLAAADPASAEARRDLAVSYSKLGDVQRQLGDNKPALTSYQQALDLLKRRAAADPANAEARRDLAVSYERLGDVQRTLADREQALASYRQALDLHQKRAAAEPGNVQAQAGLFVSYWKLGNLDKSADRFAEAALWFRQGRAVLEPWHRAGKLVGQQKDWFARAEAEIVSCQTAERAVADLDFAVKQPAEQVPQLLDARVRVWQQRGRQAEVAATADKLRTLADLPGNPAGANLYDAACGYALAAACADADAPTKEQHARTALEVLRLAQGKGYFHDPKRIEHLKGDKDLDALRRRSDYQDWLAGLEKPAGERRP
jgi:tetratricopeptide (TPR) repeat protein